MRKLRTTYSSVVIAALLLASCSTSRQVHSYSWKKPRFIDSIALGENSRQVSITTNNHRYWSNTHKPTGNNVADNLNTPDNSPAYDPSKTNVLQLKYAGLLGILPQAITNYSLYSFIDDWYGVRYRLGGNDKTGIDCSAFVQRLYENVFGMNLVRTAFEQFNTCSMVFNTDDMKEGDLVFFYSYTYTRGRHHKMKVSGKRISHVGIYLANDHFVHASSSYGVTISSLKEEYWAGKFAGAGQIPKG